MPRVKSVLRRIFRPRFPGSENYWIDRYHGGGTSGAGSYGRLADYKADVINKLIDELGVESVVEYGSGDGNQASLFTFQNYTGVDVAKEVVARCSARFADRPSWRFITVAEDRTEARTYDMAISLDVIYHLIENRIFDDYMTRLTHAARQYVLVYASDFDKVATGAAHVRHRTYSEWIAQNAPHFQPVRDWDHPFPLTPDSDPNLTSFASFRLFQRSE